MLINFDILAVMNPGDQLASPNYLRVNSGSGFLLAKQQSSTVTWQKVCKICHSKISSQSDMWTAALSNSDIGTACRLIF